MTEKQTTNETKKMPLKRTITGGVLGATIGYLATPENSKKLVARINDTEWKEKGKELGKATKGKVAELKDAGKKKSQEAYQRVKEAKVFQNEKSDQEDQESDQEVTTELVNKESYHELKEENARLQERLNNLEEKLNKIADTGDEKGHSKILSYQQSDNNNQNSNHSSANNGEKRTNQNQSEKSESTDTAISNDDDTNS
ncbi:hypothetical protein SAMN04487944_104161 [Gracilibacillus ureilyticus]|uniref:Gas vesicle protein n=1 Tax=Gracilibacillus ureilyticus TaxID=531814 RepID=A0A1H9PBG6_9BACI|nr:YtxH domain-containing protein [Gracilibacillus ureilyticus]SER44923.1 hypothetical protein SAMN04487944_104161 [Gracilibacillus ureilyticus]